MKQTIALKIDVSKIDKNRLYKGEKGTYLDAVLLFDTEQDRFENNGMIVQSVSKDERLSGLRGEILGNAKLLSIPANSGEVRSKGKFGTEQSKVNHNDMSDLPF
jgi:hypothetical protein